MTLKQKITSAITDVVPNDPTLTISFSRSGVEDTIIVRVVTSAWKSLPVFMRVLKIQRALQQALTPREQEKVFRVSVLTPTEVVKQAIVRAATKNFATTGSSSQSSLAVKIAAKLKANRTASQRNKNKALIKALQKLKKS